MNTNNSVMALATRFNDKGDWTLEQQFVLQMGSSYLMAHGLGTQKMPRQKSIYLRTETTVYGFARKTGPHSGQRARLPAFSRF